jgi:hypothetical protein
MTALITAENLSVAFDGHEVVHDVSSPSAPARAWGSWASPAPGSP